ncbi:MAG: molecular chaperone TorD family protein [Coriobacteriaceae bacterium]|nr:molecular chaperone TorD family protein [Coriobacteriaceae bacterium]
MATELTQDTQEIIELFESRVNMYGLLSRLFRSEIDLDELHELQKMHFPTATGNAMIDEGYRDLYEYLKVAWEDSVTELRIDYVRTFIGHGVNGYSAAYPFESVYTSERRLLMQGARKEVLAEFRKNHLKKDKWTEGEDHIALELEFIQRLSMRTIEALKKDDEDDAIEQIRRQYEFLQAHINNWLPMMTADMLKFSQTGFYQGLAKLALAYTEDDEGVLRELLESVEEEE